MLVVGGWCSARLVSYYDCNKLSDNIYIYCIVKLSAWLDTNKHSDRVSAIEYNIQLVSKSSTCTRNKMSNLLRTSSQAQNSTFSAIKSSSSLISMPLIHARSLSALTLNNLYLTESCHKSSLFATTSVRTAFHLIMQVFFFSKYLQEDDL